MVEALSASCEMTPFVLFLPAHPCPQEDSSPYGFGRACHHFASGMPSCGFVLVSNPSCGYSRAAPFFCDFSWVELQQTPDWLKQPLFWGVCLFLRPKKV